MHVTPLLGLSDVFCIRLIERYAIFAKLILVSN